MRLRNGIRRWLRLALRRGELHDEQLESEIELHLELRAAQLVERGYSPAAARAEALRRFGLMTDARRSLYRAARGRDRRMMLRETMDAVRQDLRIAGRRLRRAPLFTAVALLSLALGIGANTAIFTLVNSVILTRPAVERPEELVEVYFRSAAFAFSTFSYPDYRELVEATQGEFSQIAASKIVFAQRDVGDGVETLPAELVTGAYFTMRGLRPAAGRLLLPEDDVTRGGHAVVVLSYTFWQRAFARDREIIGQEIRLNGRPFTIVGVAPESHRGQLRGIEPAIYAPILMVGVFESERQLDENGAQSLFVTARLAPGVTLARVHASLESYTHDMRAAGWLPESRAIAVRTLDVIVNPSIDRLLVAIASVMTAVVGLTLLIACANLASFLLAQARDRRKEIAIRLALGATRSGLVRQLLNETVLLAGIGGALGLGLAVLLLRALVTMDIPFPIPISVDVTPNARVLAFTAGVSLLAGVLLGLAPALQATRRDIVGAIKDANAGGGLPARLSLRNVLVAGQVAASLVLLVAAGLFFRSLVARQDVDPGFGHAPAAIVRFALPADPYGAEQGRLFAGRALDEVSRIPRVTSAGLTSNLHLNVTNTNWMDVNIDGHSPPEGASAFQIDFTLADPGWFEATGIRLLRGRLFDDALDRPDAPAVAVVSQALVDRFWPGEDGLGRTIRLDSGEMRVIGVVATARIRTLGEAPRPFIYRPLSQRYFRYLTLVAQTSGDANAIVPEIVSKLRNLERELVFIETTTMERHLSLMLLPARLGALVVGAASALALVLAVIGLYGVVSYAVASRTREVGIRMSLGADRSSVVRLMMSGALRLVATGAGLGLLLAAAGGSLLRSLLFGVEPLDPVTFAGVPLLLCGIAALAAWLPARRASRIDPVRALKAQ